jgi:hypothetical protein
MKMLGMRRVVLVLFALVAASAGCGIGQSYADDNATIKVSFDVKPHVCPNVLNVINVKKNTFVSVAVAGGFDAEGNPFDVNSVEPMSVRLVGTVGTDTVEIAPIRYGRADVATPYFPSSDDAADCSRDGSDGVTDLVLKFRLKEMMKVLGTLKNGEVKVLKFVAEFKDPAITQTIEGKDIVVIKSKNKKPKPPRKPRCNVVE